MSNVGKFLLISTVVAAVTIAPVVEFTALNLAPSSAVAQFWRSFTFGRRRPPVPLGTRGNVCPMAPGLLDKDFTVLRDRPLFIWQGKAVQLTVREFHSKTVVWQAKSLDPNTQQIVYGAKEPLQPDVVYEWQILGEKPVTTDLDRWEMLSVMSPAERNQHDTALQNIEQKAKSQNSSVEAIADAKINYLVDQKLWSDALQVLSEVKNPSAQFVQNRKEFMAGLCPEAIVQAQ